MWGSEQQGFRIEGDILDVVVLSDGANRFGGGVSGYYAALVSCYEKCAEQAQCNGIEVCTRILLHNSGE